MKVELTAITQPMTLSKGNESNELFKPYSMTPEEYVIYCARISTKNNRLNHETAPKLLKFLIDNKHWPPFEMISIAFEIETSRAIVQQILRHRSFSFQEFSQQYAEVNSIEPVELRYQAKNNRQSSSDVVNDNSVLNSAIKRHLKDSQNLYDKLITWNVAKECARMILPLTTQTTIVMHGTLCSWIHFLEQRCSDHAQKEIRLIADEIKSQLSKVCPWTAETLNWRNKSDE